MGKYILKLKTTGASKGASAGFLNRKEKFEKWDISVSGILDYLMTHQLIIASHTKIKYIKRYEKETIHFKTEYIIPQFILQWLRLNDHIVDGIKYISCTGVNEPPDLSNTHDNYVLPVQTSSFKGYCPALSRLFVSSEVYSHLDKEKPENIHSTLNRITEKIEKSEFASLMNIPFFLKKITAERFLHLSINILFPKFTPETISFYNNLI
jgi:hypothetical protein